MNGPSMNKSFFQMVRS